MIRHYFSLLLAITFAPYSSAFATSPAGHLKEPLVQRIKQEKGMRLPTHGLTMKQVRKRYGKPLQVLPQRGGDTRRHPPIERWRYDRYIVYFESAHVIHTVPVLQSNRHTPKRHPTADKQD